MSSTTEEIKQTLNNNIFPHFKVENKQEIIQYIQKHPDLTEIIEKSIPIIQKHFPQNTYKLKYIQDPEIDELSTIIVDITSNFNNFDEEWKKIEEIDDEIRNLKVKNEEEKFNFMTGIF